MNIITDINERLQALECQTVGFETLQQEMSDTCQNIKRLQRESATLRGRLDDVKTDHDEKILYSSGYLMARLRMRVSAKKQLSPSPQTNWI